MKNCLLLAASMIVSGAEAADSHPFSVDDLVRLDRMAEPALSPDSRHVVFSVRETDMEADRGRTDLGLLDVDVPSATAKRITSNPENDGSPQWSRVSGHIYFLSSRTGSQQVWRMSLTGGEAQP
ncbi:MAG TPA: hypothetical protein VET48_07230, partial [Steroidobacteraceae bacterium]|nr:hypothetical protein [Steroidobacteraceae bacterium]